MTAASRAVAAALVLALTTALGACSASSPELSVSGAYVPQPPAQDVAGGFLTVHNKGGEADELTSVSSDIAGEVEIHTTQGNSMRQVESLPVPAGGKLELARGGNHLMLKDLEKKPVEGRKVRLTLHFRNSDPVQVTAPVRATNHVPAP